MIVVSELVANAVRYAPRIAGGRIVVSVIREPDAVRVEVRDPGIGFVVTPDPDREAGLGLVVVDRIADDWGIRGGATTVVWCQIALLP